MLLASAMPLTYGVPVAVDAPTGKYRGIGAGDTAAFVAGLLVRSDPGASIGVDRLGAVAPSALGIVHIIQRGHMMVLLGGTMGAAEGGAVHVRIASPADGKPVGGLKACLGCCC